MTSDVNERAHERVATGVKRLDFILEGGLLRGGAYLIVGPPGAGKTVLCNQICFHRAALGHHAAYVTLLAESTSRTLAHLSPMAFFDASRVGRDILYLSGFGVLEQSGLEGLLAMLQRTMREHRAELLVVDGIDTAAEYAPSSNAFHRFVRELQATGGLLGCTILLTAPRRPAHDLELPHTVVDGLIELDHKLIGPRGIRELVVQKFRGSGFLAGRHEVELGEQGVIVHPRTEVRFRTPPSHAVEERKTMRFGLRELDELLDGGVLSSSATTLIGAPGTGKTLLGLHFLATGAEEGEDAMYFGFHETPPRLCAKAEAIGLPLSRLVDAGELEIQWQPPIEIHLDALAERLLERLVAKKKAHPERRLRLFIDGVAGFRSAAAYPERLGPFFSALLHELRSLDVTTLLSDETTVIGPGVDVPDPELASTTDNMLLLRYVEYRTSMRRLISVIKVRETAYDASVREFRIDRSGIHVAPDSSSAAEILEGAFGRSGTSRPRRRGRPAARRFHSGGGP